MQDVAAVVAEHKMMIFIVTLRSKNSSVKYKNYKSNWINVIFVVQKMKGPVEVQKEKIISTKIQVRVPAVKMLPLVILEEFRIADQILTSRLTFQISRVVHNLMNSLIGATL